MAVSAFDLFKIGIGPSSSHTVGPMRAARLFAHGLETAGLLPAVARVQVGLYGSLGATGRGHGSDKAVLLGLCGHEPESVPIESVEPTVRAIREQGRIPLMGTHTIAWADREDLTSRWRTLDPAERREEEAELERLQVEARRAAQDLRSDLAKTEQRLLGGMLRAIVRIAGKVGKQEGYDLVIDRRQARVLYAADSADLTDEVIAAYDAEVKEADGGP